MIPFLLATSFIAADANQNYLPPIDEPSYSVCLEMEHELQQAVEFDLITADQMADVLIRCYINYQ